MQFKLLAAALLVSAEVSAAELSYDFRTLDIDNVELVDINSRGEILMNLFSRDGRHAALRSGRKTTAFYCDLGNFDPATDFRDTYATSLNDRGQSVGWCFEQDATHGREASFIRERNGAQRLLEFPGADQTIAQGISADGKVTGQVISQLVDNHGGPLSYRFHCFTWDRVNGFRRIDYLENTYLNCLSINKRGQILGEYITVTLQNEYLEHGFFVYDNGTFTVPFPLSHDFEGGPSTYAADMNEDGAVIGFRHPNDGTATQIFFFDDGQFYDIRLPEGWLLTSLGGMNNTGGFVGSYRIQVDFDEFYQMPIYETHGFVAKPR
jgi:Protein of unknown function (DUF3466)